VIGCGRAVSAIAAVIIAALCASCEYEGGEGGDLGLFGGQDGLVSDYLEPEDRYEGPWVPDISGDWQGVYSFTDYGHKAAGERNPAAKMSGTPITAVIAFDPTNHTFVTVTTSLQGRAHYLTGRIDAAGNMRMVDAYDGELWTTHFRRAATNLVELNDFVLPGERGPESNLGMRTLFLDQHLPPPKEDISYFGYAS